MTQAEISVNQIPVAEMQPVIQPAVIDQHLGLQERGSAKIVAMIVVGALAVGSLVAWRTDVFSGDNNSTTVEPNGKIVDSKAPVVNRLEQGDKPCGRVITQTELQAHFAQNPDSPVTNPTEANDFMDWHPNLKASMLNFYDQHYGGMVDWVNANKSKTSKKLEDRSGDREQVFYNRLKVVELTSPVTVDNHNCDVNSGAITDLGAQTLQAGDFVYGFDLKSTKQLNRFLHQSGLNREDVLLTQVTMIGKGGKPENRWFIVVNRSTCNNPLTPVKPGVPGTTPSTQPEITTTTLGNKDSRKDYNQPGNPSPNVAPGSGGQPGPEGTISTTPTTVFQIPGETTPTTIVVPGGGTPGDPTGECGAACE